MPERVGSRCGRSGDVGVWKYFDVYVSWPY